MERGTTGGGGLKIANLTLSLYPSTSPKRTRNIYSTVTQRNLARKLPHHGFVYVHLDSNTNTKGKREECVGCTKIQWETEEKISSNQDHGWWWCSWRASSLLCSFA